MSRKLTRAKSDTARTKREVNFRLLASTVIIAVAGTLLAYFWYDYRTKHVAEIFEQRATSLEKEGRWRDAAAYLNRHLRLAPDDIDARVRLVLATERFATTGPEQRLLIGELYETLGFCSERTDLRLKLANALLETGDIVGADKEARKVLITSKKPEERRGAQRAIALSLRARARRGGQITIEQAAQALSDASDKSPTDTLLASTLAELYREYPQDSGINDAASKADAIMDRMVAANPQNPDALITRYIYRHRYLDNAQVRQDLDNILARDPNHVEALLLLADEEWSKGAPQDRKAAEQKLRKVIELRPNDPRGHVRLARLHLAQGRSKQALEVLLHSRAQISGSSIEFDQLLTGLLIGSNRLDEADKALSDYDSEYRRLLPQLTTDGRLKLENISRLLRAHLAIARNNPGQAIRDLNAILAVVDQAEATAGAKERSQAYDILATIMAKLGRLDVAAADWKAAADLSPDMVDARMKSAAAYLELGRPADAIGQLELYLQSPSASPEARITLVLAYLQQQMRLSANERKWGEFNAVLTDAKQKLPQRWELVLDEALYHRSLGTNDSKQQALDELQQVEKQHPNEGALFGQLVLAYQQLGATSDAERALARYEKLEPSKTRRVLLRSALLIQQGQVQEAEKLLANASSQGNARERLELQLAWVKSLATTSHLEAAQKTISNLIATFPQERAPLILGLEIAHSRQDYTMAVQWENALKGLDKVDEFDWRYFRAQRLIRQFASLDDKSRGEVDTLIDSLRSARPDWPPLVALAGQHADLTGNRREAIDAYRLAIDLGEKRPQVFERLINALYSDGRFNEANVYLSRLGSAQPEDSRVETLAIASAVKENRLGAALDMAKKAVDRGSSDPLHHVWLANLLSLNGRQAEAEQAFDTSIQRFPKDSRVWSAYFTHLVRTKQADRARGVLERWTNQVPADEAAKHFILAQGYEQLGDVVTAQQQYREVTTKDSRNVDARLRLAKLLMSSNVSAARGQFEEVLKIDPKNAEARRYTATILATSGDEQDWTHAAQLLQVGQRTDAVDEAGTDDRLRAILLTRRGRNRKERLKYCEAARGLLTTRIAQPTNPDLDLDRMLLAGIYEQEAAMRGDVTLVLAARDAIRPLVDRKSPSADHLASYIQLLLRHVERKQAKSADDMQTAGQRTILIDDARARIGELEGVVGDKATIEHHFRAMAFRARLLVAEGKRDEGNRLLNDFAAKNLRASSTQLERAKLLLQLGNLATTTGYHQEAEVWYRELVGIAPDSYRLLAKSLVEQNRLKDAVEVCLRAAPNRPAGEVATVLTQLVPASANNPELEQRIQPIISLALDANSKNVELLMSLAVRQVSENNNDEAIRLFRRILDLRPDDPLTLNNLATLLADRPNELGEARKYVEQAMALAGRNPALLDTLGTIMFRSGKHEEAVLALEEAVAGTAIDPRYYFHLAVAYQQSGRAAQAHEALDNARKYGLDRAMLTKGDRELLASLNNQLPSSADRN